MVGVLIEMRAAIMRRQTTGKRAAGGLVLALVVTMLAVGTLVAGLKHYRYDGAGANVIATLSLGWLLGWVTGPLLIGDDAALRMDYFKLLPIPPRKLARAMLGAAFANVSLVFSLIAFAALIALGAQFGAAAALTGAAAVILYLVLAVVASRVAIAVFGPTISSRRGRDFGTMVVALVITLLSLASSLVPFVAARLTNGHSPTLSAVVRILPSGWGAVAVDAASRSDWGLVAASLGGLAALIAVLVLAWPSLLTRRLSMTGARARRGRSAARHGAADGSRLILPATPAGAVLGRELRLYSRSVLRSMLLMISFLVGVLVGLIGALSGNSSVAAVRRPAVHGDRGGLLHQLLRRRRHVAVAHPGRAGRRGRRRPRPRPGLAAGRRAGRAAAHRGAHRRQRPGLGLAVGAGRRAGHGDRLRRAAGGDRRLVGQRRRARRRSLARPGAQDAPGARSPSPSSCSFPPAALLIGGAAGHSALLRWLAVPVAIGWAVLLSRRSARAAVRRLETRGPEMFARVRTTA